MDTENTFETQFSNAFKELALCHEQVLVDLISHISIKDVEVKIYRNFRVGLFIDCLSLETINYAGINETILNHTNSYMSMEFIVPKGFYRNDQKKKKMNKSTVCFFIQLDFQVYRKLRISNFESSTG